MANSYPASGQVILDDLKVCTSARLQPHFVSYGEHMFMNLESAHNNSYLPVVTFSRAGCTLGAIGLERASNSDTVGSYAESEMVIGTRANTPTSIQSGGVRRMVITTAGNVNVQGGGILSVYRSDNTRALQLYTTVNETVIDSWEASSEPLHIRSMGTGGRIQFFTNGSERLRINCAGNIGIGTCSPTSPLHLRDSTNGFVGLRIEGSGTYAGSDFTIYSSALSPNSADDFLGFYNNSSTDGATEGYKLRLFKSGVANFVGNIGIGTTSPSTNLHICDANALGRDDMIRLTQGNVNNHAYVRSERCNGAMVLMGATRNSFDGCIPSDSGIVWSFCNNPIVIGSCNRERMRITGAGSVGIGITSPSYQLHVNGTFYAAGSSIEYKEGISQYDTDSCLFMCLKPKTYQYKDEWKHLGKDLKSGIQIGLIAEEVAEIMPELAVLVNEEENKVVRNVDYEKLSIILLSEVQKLRKEVDNLKNNK
jgi:hypothetical protein